MNNGFTVWLTGLPCSGKSTLASALGRALLERGRLVEVLDGDVVRQNLSKGLGFSREDRDTNIRRIGFVAKLLTRNGAATVVAAVSPYASVRREVKEQIGSFIQVFVSCPVTVCEERDVKGMYALARAGKIKDFTGVDDPYEAPEDADVVVRTDQHSIEECISQILKIVEARGLVAPPGEVDPALAEELQIRYRALGYHRG